jgi:heme a synthase
MIGVLTLGLLVWVWRAESRRWIRWLSLGAFLLVVLQGAMGGLAVLTGLPKSVSILHACAAQLFFGLAVALAAFTSPSWQGATLALEDTGFPPLRFAAAIVPVAVLGQTALGAAYRHGALGLMPHVVGALAVTALVLLASTIVLTQHGESRVVAKPAKRLLIITLHQVVLGVLAYVTRIITGGAGGSGFLAVVVPVAHVAVGALTMGASVLFAVQVGRHLHSPVLETTP